MSETDGQASYTEVARARPTGWRLFLAFLRLGLTAFGGPAMVAYIRELAVKKKGWLADESFQDGVALCQSIPGATAMQTAAYVGLRAGGPWGALAAFVGFGLPAFALMLVLSAVYQASRNVGLVISAFHGLHLIVIALIANAAVNFGRTSIKNWRDGLLAAGAAVWLAMHGSPIIAIVAAAILGAILYHGIKPPPAKAHAGQPTRLAQSLAVPGILMLLTLAGLASLFLFSRPLLDLSTLMLKVDLFAFGGGFASIPLMLHEVVDLRGWMDNKTFMDGIALGQVTPGPIVITATFVGYQTAGVLGAVVGTISIFTPSFLMVLLTVPYFDRMQKSPLFRRVLRAILASFVGLLLAVAINFGVAVHWTFPGVAIAVAAFVALRLKVDILWVVLAGGALSVFVL